MAQVYRADADNLASDGAAKALRRPGMSTAAFGSLIDQLLMGRMAVINWLFKQARHQFTAARG
jgi:hypothetical protein